jgi:serine/threonine protein kinase
VLEELG